MPAVFLPFMPLLLAVALTFGFFTLMDSQAAKYLDACRVASLRAVENGLSTVRGLENLNPRAKFLSLERAKVELRLSNALAHRNSKAIANAKAQREDIIQQQVVLGRSQKAMVAAYFALLKTGAAQIQQEIRGSGTTSLTNNKIQFLVVIPQFHFPLTPDVDGRPAPEYV